MTGESRQIKSFSEKFLKLKNNLIFGLVPLLLALFMIFRLEEIHVFFQVWFDPVYAYLMNGLTFALGSCDIGHVDHPGTPLQLLVALLIRFFALFSGNNDLAVDVLTHPESYLRFISIVLIALNCGAIWLLGLFAYRNIGNRNMAVTVQLIPLMIFQLVNFMPIVACETAISFTSMTIVSCFLLYEIKAQIRWPLVIMVAFLSAFMVATKISTLVMLVVPFIFFEKRNHRISFLFLSLIFIFIFILPVWEKLGTLAGLLEKIATHTGQYGTGEAKLFDAAVFFQSIGKMMTKELAFTVHVLLIPFGWIVIIRRKIRGLLFRLYLALTIATFLQIIVVARHYSFHYLMPVFVLAMPLQGIFWLKIFKDKIESWSPWFVRSIVILMVVVVFGRLIIRNHFLPGIVNPVEKTTEVIQKELPGNYIILTDFNSGMALVGPALKFGYSYCGPTAKIRYANVLKSVFTKNYYWNIREGFTNWQGNLSAPDVFLAHKNVYLYANAGDCSVSRQKIEEMVQLTGMSGFLQMKPVFQNKITGEIILEAQVDTLQMRKSNHPEISK